jgi:hypothetical protein
MSLVFELLLPRRHDLVSRDKSKSPSISAARLIVFQARYRFALSRSPATIASVGIAASIISRTIISGTTHYRRASWADAARAINASCTNKGFSLRGLKCPAREEGEQSYCESY